MPSLPADSRPGNPRPPRFSRLTALLRSIASFLHGANPRHWPLATRQAALKMHLDQTAAEATHHLHGDFAADVKDYDEIVTHILARADVLSDGIVAEFPERFQ